MDKLAVMPRKIPDDMTFRGACVTQAGSHSWGSADPRQKRAVRTPRLSLLSDPSRRPQEPHPTMQEPHQTHLHPPGPRHTQPLPVAIYRLTGPPPQHLPHHFPPRCPQPSQPKIISSESRAEEKESAVSLVHFRRRLPFQEWDPSQAHMDIINALAEEVPCPFGHLKHKTKTRKEAAGGGCTWPCPGDRPGRGALTIRVTIMGSP